MPGWTFSDIDRLTMADALAIFDYWRDWPPLNELKAMEIGYKKPMTVEEQWEAGAMGPGDFLEHFKRTGGKLN